MRKPTQRLGFQKLFIFKLFITIVLTFVSWLLYREIFLISKTECVFGTGPCPNAVKAHLLAQKNLPITKFNEIEFSTQIKQLSPFFSTVSVVTHLPGTVELNITPAQEIAMVSNSSQSAGLVVTDTLMVTRQQDNTTSGLTKVIYPALPQLEVGANITDDTLSQVLLLVTKLRDNYIAIESLTVELDKISVRISQQTVINFNLSKNFDQQIRVAQIILNKQFEQPVKVIDVRFDKPTIVFVQ